MHAGRSGSDSQFSIRQGLLARGSPESLFYVLFYSLLSTVQI